MMKLLNRKPSFIKTLLACCLLISVNGLAVAEEEKSKRLLEGWYVGFGAGWTWNDVERSDFPDDGDIDDTGRGYRFLLGYRITPIFSIEGRYLYLSDVEFDTGDISSHAWLLNAIVTSPPIVIPGSISLGSVMAKIAATYVYRNQDSGIMGRDVDGGEFGWAYGLGWVRNVSFLSRYVPGDFYTRLEWERLFDDAYDTDFLSIGLIYAF